MARPTTCGGFTMLEVVIATSLGIVLINATVMMLWMYNKSLRNIDYTNARADLMQNAMMTVMARAPYLTYSGKLDAQFTADTFPTERARGIGIKQITLASGIYTIQVVDYLQNSSKQTIGYTWNVPFPGDQ